MTQKGVITSPVLAGKVIPGTKDNVIATDELQKI
jgi:hypothetical protein